MNERKKLGGKISDIHKLKSKVVIYLDDSNKIELSPLTFTEFNLYINKVLSENDVNKIISFNEFSKQLDYSLSLINKYQYTTLKLRKKLIKKEYSEININKIMDYINKYHLINDFEFAKLYALDMINKNKGEVAIEHKLKELGISKKNINIIIDTLDINTLTEQAKKFIIHLDKKYQDKPFKKNKIIASLTRRGYSYKIIYKALDEVNLTKSNYQNNLSKDYLKFKRIYDNDNKKIIKALNNKGYSYSKIKEVIKENDNDLY